MTKHISEEDYLLLVEYKSKDWKSEYMKLRDTYHLALKKMDTLANENRMLKEKS